jgi:hypothetical protein
MRRARATYPLQLLIVALLSGCAAGRTVVPASIDSGLNPVQGTAVRIEPVQDARIFAVKPPSPDTPSLMEDNEIGDKTITSRAVGRKRGGFGAALGDVLLPEGQTVPLLVEAAVARALRESGYRVIERDGPGHEQAVPIAVRIDRFWSWFNPGFASVTLSFRGAIFLRGDIPQMENGRLVSTQLQEHMQAVFESDWQAIVNKGLESLVTATKEILRPASGSEARQSRVAANSRSQP